jgi:GTP 3',8-cyclase
LIKIDTLRVAITDRCNLRCVYCMPTGGIEPIPHDEVLSFEEIERVVKAAAAAGVSRVRITGGEPLVRRDMLELVARLARIDGVADLPMTTNGVLLAENAAALKNAGLSRVTVSLDTLRPDRYEQITGRPELPRVMAGIAAAREAGLTPVKVNAVVVPDENEDEAVDFARLAIKMDMEVRFIERMPIRGHATTRCGLTSDAYVPAATLKARIEAELGPIAELNPPGPRRPARVYALPGGRGRIGFIAPMSEPFCSTCSRLRLTPDGKLRVCLALDLELDLKRPLRQGVSDAGLAELFARAVAMKPKQNAACWGPGQRVMAQIGG